MQYNNIHVYRNLLNFIFDFSVRLPEIWAPPICKHMRRVLLTQTAIFWMWFSQPLVILKKDGQGAGIQKSSIFGWYEIEKYRYILL